MEFFPTQVRDDKTLLRREFLKLSLVHHPDKEPDPNLKASATSTFQRIQSAYDDLCNVLSGKCPSDAKVALRTKSLLSAACEAGDYEKVQRLLKVRPAWAREADEVGKTPLMYAVEAGSLEICKELVKARASIHDHNRSGWTALVMAAIRDQADIAGWLLESGATLSDPVFQLAAHVGGAGVMELLLRLDAPGVATKRLESGWPLLHVALGGFVYLKNPAEKHFKTVNLLLDAACDVSATTPKGDTALWIFVEMMDRWELPDHSELHLRMAQRICELGADPCVAGSDGISAIEHAKLQGRYRLLRRLDRAAKAHTSRGSAETTCSCLMGLLANQCRWCEDWTDWWRSRK
mmetsp:Transcript_59578/g.103934  ORF Transcript_59578/g.103934 Transcript_59578/m.103934 type:complete len:349 (-) Transcript_59578:143-1189(-)